MKTMLQQSEEDNDNATSSSDKEVDLSFLLVDKAIKEASVLSVGEDVEDKVRGPYEVIEELMQPRMDCVKK